ncbi:MAG: hypothetical protein J6A63_08170 [Clostridia bacterium]|nr:hypothetical protein [Clostridia bacterium]
MSDLKNFDSRYNLGDELIHSIKSFFNNKQIELIPFGVERLCENKALKEYINSAEVNYSHSGMLVKFAPDFILLTKDNPQKLYFIETKVSITPLCYPSIIKEIETRHDRKIPVSDIGVIAREAWNAYKTLYPNLIIVSASTYNPQLLKAQFVDKIQCLRCYNGGSKVGYDCTKCPLLSREFFSYERNFHSQGSQTPQTNLDLASFEEFETFFDMLDIETVHENVEQFKEKMKARGVFFQGNLYESIKKNISEQLKAEGCYWVK